MDDQATEPTTAAAPPTTRDLARAAGVSLATVDRVLNGRDGVRRTTVERVRAAVAELGFVRNAAAANLAKRRAYRFLFVLPSGGDLFLATLAARIREAGAALAPDGVRADLAYVDAADPHAAARLLRDLDPRAVDGLAIMAPESPPLRDALRRLRAAGVKVLPLVSDQRDAPRGDFVGIDDRAAGATAALLMGKFADRRPGSVLVLAETMASRDSLDRRQGFDRELARRFPHLRALPSVETHGAPARARTVLANALAHHPDLRGIYVSSPEARVPLETMAALGVGGDIVRIVHERTEATLRALREDRVDAVITLDPGHVARSALRRLKAHRDGRATIPAQERIRTEILLATNA